MIDLKKLRALSERVQKLHAEMLPDAQEIGKIAQDVQKLTHIYMDVSKLDESIRQGLTRGYLDESQCEALRTMERRWRVLQPKNQAAIALYEKALEELLAEAQAQAAILERKRVDGWSVVNEQICAVLLPFCRDKDEAEQLARQTSRLQDMEREIYAWKRFSNPVRLANYVIQQFAKT